MSDYISDLVLTNYQNYSNYFCHLDTENYICIFNNQDLLYEGNILSYDNAKICTVTKDYKVSCTYSNSANIDLVNPIGVYTDVSDTYPSIIANLQYDNAHNLAYNVNLSGFYLILLLLCLPVLLSFLGHFFRSKGAILE